MRMTSHRAPRDALQDLRSLTSTTEVLRRQECTTAVRHGELSLCFVYKFGQRFGVVAETIAKGLGRDTKRAVNACRTMNMFLDDFQCCEGVCGDAC